MTVNNEPEIKIPESKFRLAIGYLSQSQKIDTPAAKWLGNHWLNILKSYLPENTPDGQTPSGYKCCVCGENPVDADAGFDTCDSCLKKV